MKQRIFSYLITDFLLYFILKFLPKTEDEIESKLDAILSDEDDFLEKAMSSKDSGLISVAVQVVSAQVGKFINFIDDQSNFL